MAKAPANAIPADRSAAYDRIVATRTEVERKGARIPYTSLIGHMTSYLTETGSLVLRLSPDDRRRFLDEHGATLHEAYGVVQKEFVDVPDALLDDTVRLTSWFAASIEWVARLKPKPTSRPG